MPTDARPQVILEFGSNSVKILQIVSLAKDALMDYRRPLRLAAEILPSGDLSEKAIQSLISQIQEVHQLYSASSDLRIFGTQALRSARNRHAIVEKVRQETAYELKILSVQEEAEAAFRGIQSGLKLPGRVICFDIGGASTEVISGNVTRILKTHSFPIGAVSLSRNSINHDPISVCEYHQMNSEISRQLKLKSPKTKVKLIGTGGSIVTCAMVALALAPEKQQKANGYRLRSSELMRQIQTYRAMTSQDIAKISGMDPSRADIILPACMIMQRLMEIYGQEEIITSGRGVRHGLVDWEF